MGAISVGLVMDEDAETGAVTRHALMADILGLEDVLGDMDFKIAGTRGGITAIQLDCKPAGIPPHILEVRRCRLTHQVDPPVLKTLDVFQLLESTTVVSSTISVSQTSSTYVAPLHGGGDGVG